jgi:ATP-dependent DNA helicase RecG
MVEQKQIDRVEAMLVLELPEGHFADVKRIEIAPAKLSESISAFANAAGGEIYIGIGEETAAGSGSNKRRFWKGFPTMEAANGIFQLLERMLPLGNHYHAAWLHTGEADVPGYVLHLVISKTQEAIPSSDGSYFVRRNSQNVKVVGDEALQRLKFDKGIASFEDNSVNVDSETITNSSTSIKFILDVIPSSEPEDWLKKQNLITKDNKPIAAGVLLFADEPQAALPKRSAIKIYRYTTKAGEGTRDQLAFDPITIEGAVYSQIHDAVARTKALIEDIKTLTPEGLETVSYPHETLHEIITNAVLHRDYSVASDIHVRIFDNRIEVESPGRLPGHITTDNYLREQFSRNPKLVRLINKFPDPPNKDIGEGLNTAFEAMRKLRLKEPEIIESDHSVLVHIRHTSLASPQDMVMDYLKDRDEITNRIARELTGVTSENVMKDVFLSLNKRDLLERVPHKRGNASAWRKYSGYWKEQKESLLDLLKDDPLVDEVGGK